MADPKFPAKAGVKGQGPKPKFVKSPPAPAAKTAPAASVTKPSPAAKPDAVPPFAAVPVDAIAKAVEMCATETAVAMTQAIEEVAPAISVPPTAPAVDQAEAAPAASRETIPVAPQDAPIPAAEGPVTMATNYDASKLMTDRMQGTFGEASERARGLFEKGSKLAEQMGELTKGNLEALAQSGKVAMKGAEEMAQYSADYGKKAVEQANSNLRSLASVKSPTELFQLQSEFAKSSFDSLIAEASKFSENYVKLMGEVVQPLSSRYAVAAEKLKTAAL